MLRWTSFTIQKKPFFIEEAPPTKEQSNGAEIVSKGFIAKKEATKGPIKREKPYGVSLVFEGIRNWHLPQVLKKDLDDGLSDVKVHLSLSLLNTESLTFFGTTWVGAPVPLIENSPEIIDINYREIAYIISRLQTPSCRGIIEIVATKYDKETRLTTAQYGCGWASRS